MIPARREAEPVVIETEHLSLRRQTAADAPFILRLLNDADFLRYIGNRGVRTVAEAATYNLGEAALYHAEVDRLHEALEMLGAYLGPRVFAYPGFRDWWRHGDRAGFAASTQDGVDAQIAANTETTPFWEYDAGG